MHRHRQETPNIVHLTGKYIVLGVVIGLCLMCTQIQNYHFPQATACTCASPNATVPAVVAAPVVSDVPASRTRDPRVLLFFASFPKRQHLQALQTCWPRLLARGSMLRSAHALVFLGGNTSRRVLEEWKHAVAHLGVNATLQHDPYNPGYQSGAMRTMRVFLDKQRGRGYDWVIRLNPDTLIYDDTHLAHFFTQRNLTAVLANCLSNTQSPAIHTDFFAVRPQCIPAGAFADWKSAPNAERQATRDFGKILRGKSFAWLLPRNFDGICRVRGNGLWHGHDACMSTLQNEPWKRMRIPAPHVVRADG